MARIPSFNHCVTAANAAYGRELTDAQLDKVFTRVHEIADRLKRHGVSDPVALARQAGAEAGAELRAAAAIERRNAMINVLVENRFDARIVPGREADSLQAIVAGFTGRRNRPGDFEGAALSVDAERHALRDQQLGGVLHDLRKDGVLKAVLARDAAFDRDVTRELFYLQTPAAGHTSGNPHALTVARVLNKYQEAMRLWLNQAGAWIGKEDGYITRQSHDMFKVRGDGSKSAFQAWRDFIAPRLDERTFDGVPAAGRDKFLSNVWHNLSSGVHETSTGDLGATAFHGPGNLAERLSHERVLHFKDADAWFDYTLQFGKGGVIDSVFASLEKGARDLALMRTFGTNPEAMYRKKVDGLIEAARDRKDFKTVDALRAGKNDRIFDVVTGKADIPADATLGQIGATVRVMEQLARLGGVVLSSLPDLAVNAAMLRHNGIGIFESYARQMTGLLPKGEAQREIAEQLGVGIDHLLGNVMYRLNLEEGVTGRMAQASRLFYRLNGLEYWTGALKSASGSMLSENLARHAAKPFADLPARFQTTLRRYGIDAADWTEMASHVHTAADGKAYVLPAHVSHPALARKLQTYIVDQVREGMTEPTAFNRAWGTLQTQRGTWGGETVRLLMQFKQYTTTYLDRSLGRELWRSREGMDAGGLAHLIVGTTALGYLSMTLKELAKGRNPRDPEEPFDYVKLAAAAFAQGGGLGIYGDFIFGEANRLGGGFVSTLAGPTAGSIDDVRQILMAIRTGEGHPLAETIQAVKNNTPFVNLFWSRAVLDHLIFYRMQEWANPGYLRRMEQRVKKENNQTFWLSPSAAAR